METANSPEGASRTARAKERLGEEMRAYALTAAYLFVWLSALFLYRTALLGLGATCLLLLLVLVPFVAAKQVSLALGPGGLRRLLLGRPG